LVNGVRMALNPLTSATLPAVLIGGEVPDKPDGNRKQTGQ
jgi:hypothetical protein